MNYLKKYYKFLYLKGDYFLPYKCKSKIYTIDLNASSTSDNPLNLISYIYKLVIFYLYKKLFIYF